MQLLQDLRSKVLAFPDLLASVDALIGTWQATPAQMQNYQGLRHAWRRRANPKV